MKEIISTKGRVIKVSDCDYEMLSRYKWTIRDYKTSSYVETTHHKSIRMHRMIMGVTDRKILVDHKDGDGLNNQRENLRLATHSTNAMNKKANGVIKYKGVNMSFQKQKYFHKGTGEWRIANTAPKIVARIKVNGVSKHIGSFKTLEDAALAYNEWAVKLHGEFAVLNEIIK